MPRQRNQQGTVEKTKTKPAKWNGRYAVYAIENGIEKRRSRELILGLCSEMTKADAEEKLRGIVRSETGAKAASDMTLWEFIHHPGTGYLALKSGKWSRTWKSLVEGIFRNYLRDSLGKVKLRDLKLVECQQWLNGFDVAVCGQSLIHKARTQLGAVLKQAYIQELIRSNFAMMFNERGAIEEPQSKKQVQRPTMKLAEIAEGLRTTARYKNKKEHLIFRLAATRGLRPCEIFALRANDIKGDQLMIDEGVVQYIIGEPKTEDSKAPVHLTEELRADLEQYLVDNKLSDSDFLFAYLTGKPMSQNNYVRRQLKTLGKKIGVPKLDFRMLRRSFATHFRKHGDPKDLQSAMRHADVTLSLEVYAQDLPEQTRKAVCSFEAEVMSLANAA